MTLAQVHKNHYIAFTVQGYNVAFACQQDAWEFAKGQGLTGAVVNANYRY